MSVAVPIVLIVFGFVCGAIVVQRENRTWTIGASTLFVFLVVFWAMLLFGFGVTQIDENAPKTFDNASELVLSVALVALTAVLAWVGWRQSNDNRKMREAATEPHVIAYIFQHPDPAGGNLLEFEVKNIGRGLARNITYEIDEDEDVLRKLDINMRIGPRDKPIPALAPGQSYKCYFGRFSDIVRQEEVRPYCLKFLYTDAAGKMFETESLIDIHAIAGIGLLGNNYLQKISNSLEKASASLHKIEKSMVKQETEKNRSGTEV